MIDLGETIGALMSGILRARRIADEHTAGLAEYYKQHPLLEGLSVPRIRIPELIIDMPIIVTEHHESVSGEMADPETIAEAVIKQVKTSLSEFEKTPPTAFFSALRQKMTKLLAAEKDKCQGGKKENSASSSDKNEDANPEESQKPTRSISRETIVRIIQTALLESLENAEIILNGEEKASIAKDIRDVVSEVSHVAEAQGPKIIPDVITSKIKEITDDHLIRLKVTFREEGLEWFAQVSENGEVLHTLHTE